VEPSAEQRIQQSLKECREEVTSLKRDVYGSTVTKQEGISDRLTRVEVSLEALKRETNKITLDNTVISAQLRGIGIAVGGIVVTVFSAILVAILRTVGWS
jgi:predicted GNAT family acetyltransferase